MTTSKLNNSLWSFGMVQARCGFPVRAFCFFLGSPKAGLKSLVTLSERVLREDFAGKCKESSLGITPRFAGQPGLAASLFQELFAGHAMFDGNLRKKKPALRVQSNQ